MEVKNVENKRKARPWITCNYFEAEVHKEPRVRINGIIEDQSVDYPSCPFWALSQLKGSFFEGLSYLWICQRVDSTLVGSVVSGTAFSTQWTRLQFISGRTHARISQRSQAQTVPHIFHALTSN
jgi:hypothetical protein